MENREFNNNLKYQGWKEMSDILDREMPEKKNRKGILLFFSLLALLAGGILLSVTMYNNDDIKADSPVMEKDIIEAEKAKNTRTKPVIFNSENGRLEKTDEENIQIKQTRGRIEKHINIKQDTKEGINGFAISDIEEKTESGSTTILRKPEEINNITLPGIRKLVRADKILPVRTNNLAGVKSKNIDLFNPFVGARTYVLSVDELTMKPGFEVGNRFLYNRYFTDISLDYLQFEIVVPRVALYDDIVYNSKLEAYTHEEENFVEQRPGLNYSYLELNVAQGYRFSKRLNAAIGIGMAYLVQFDNTSKEIDMAKESDFYNIEYDKYTFSSGIDFSYVISNRFSFNLGYKYFFNSNYKLHYDKNLLYRAKVIRRSRLSGINLGIRLWF